MKVTELSRDQLKELKIAYMDREGNLSMSEVLEADELIPDEVVFLYYANYDFTPDDFSCTAELEAY